MTVAEAKREYNNQLERYYKAENFFNSDIPQEEKEKFLPDFQKLLKGLSQLLRKIGVYTHKEVMEGFDE
ncbi:hypothetical protein [Gudongella sp. SC589]|uniref:hypothetical protein n=1 Tax=Gudongella sp. SC589 TaxID=3385990 RepID=UPI003904B625